MLRETPWKQSYKVARHRCSVKRIKESPHYAGKGIICLMDVNDFKYLLFRDKAYEMEKPSIDRIDSNGNYELENCRFIEFKINIKNKCPRNELGRYERINQ